MRNNREHRFQAFADRFLDRVVLPPFWVTGIDHASNVSDNARARARARGLKPGVPDIYLAQGEPTRTLWLELKRGTSPSDAQLSVHRSLADCGVPCYVASSIKGVLVALYGAGIRLHGNAANIATEIEAKLTAADEAVPRVARSSRPRVPKPSRAAVTRGNRFTARGLGI